MAAVHSVTESDKTELTKKQQQHWQTAHQYIQMKSETPPLVLPLCLIDETGQFLNVEKKQRNREEYVRESHRFDAITFLLVKFLLDFRH